MIKHAANNVNALLYDPYNFAIQGQIIKFTKVLSFIIGVDPGFYC